MQDFADLAVARELGVEEEGCTMHNDDKTARFAIGILEKTKNKEVVDGFPEGKALIEAVRNACKEFSYESKRKELHSACTLATPPSPELCMKLDHNETRVAAVRSMLQPPLRMINGMKLFRATHAGVASQQVNDEKWQSAAEFESILGMNQKITTLVQHERACTGGYKVPLYEMVENAFEPVL